MYSVYADNWKLDIKFTYKSSTSVIDDGFISVENRMSNFLWFIGFNISIQTTATGAGFNHFS